MLFFFLSFLILHNDQGANNIYQHCLKWTIYLIHCWNAMDLSYPSIVQFFSSKSHKPSEFLVLRSWQCSVNVQWTFFIFWSKSLSQTIFILLDEIRSKSAMAWWSIGAAIWNCDVFALISSFLLRPIRSAPSLGGGREGGSREEVGAKKFLQEARRAASRGLLLTGPTITA